MIAAALLLSATSTTTSTSSVATATAAPELAVIEAPSAPPPLDPCEDSAMFDPVALSFTAGPLASARRACLRDELAIGVSGGATIRTTEFYGRISAAGLLSVSTVLAEELELFGALELVSYEQVISSLTASHFGLGHLALGATQALVEDEETTLAATGHVTLPTAPALYDRTYPFALDAGATGATRLGPDLEVHAYAGLRASIGAGAGPPDPAAGVILDAGGAYRIAPWLALALDLEGKAGERAALDHVALGIGIRFRVAEGLKVELAAKAPLAGDERSLASAYVGVAYWE